MNPQDLAKSGDESGEQKALFCWAAMARLRGFDAAFDMQQYTLSHTAVGWMGPERVPELKWLYASPNGGLRTARTAARMKAEGVRVGVADICLPVKTKTWPVQHNGLYIELKRIKGGTISPEQIEFGEFVRSQGYFWNVCRGWYEAALVIRGYLV